MDDLTFVNNGLVSIYFGFLLCLGQDSTGVAAASCSGGSGIRRESQLVPRAGGGGGVGNAGPGSNE